MSRNEIQINSIVTDVDGTLQNDSHVVTPMTRNAIHRLNELKIPFTIASARSPAGILPILRQNQFRACMIAFSGALLCDEEQNILWEKGMTKGDALRVTAFAEKNHFDCVWNVNTARDWIAQNPEDPRTQEEASVIGVHPSHLTMKELPDDSIIDKVLLITSSLEETNRIQPMLEQAFPRLCITRSWITYLEIMAGGVNKAEAVRTLCRLRGLDPSRAAAFGDNYNDMPMLEAVGHGVLMANAPAELREHFPRITEDNNHDGVARELRRLGVI